MLTDAPRAATAAPVLAALSAGAGVIHAAMAPSHMAEWGVEGVAFALVAWAQLLLAAALLRRPSLDVLQATIILNLGVLAAWLVSRTAGFPFGPEEGVALLRELAAASPMPAPPDEDLPPLSELDRAVDLLIELKDLSEAAVGMAYSSILFNNRALAAEVGALEARSDILHDELESWVLRAAPEARNVDDLRGLLRLGSASESMCDAARDLTWYVERGEPLHPVIQLAFEEWNAKGGVLGGRKFVVVTVSAVTLSTTAVASTGTHPRPVTCTSVIDPAGRTPEPEYSPSTVRLGPRESKSRAGLNGTKVVPAAEPHVGGVTTPPARYEAR